MTSDLPDAIPPLQVGPFTFRSRLLVGTGKYADHPTMVAALAETGADVITVAVRRAKLEERGSGGSLLDHIDPERYQLLPNTAGCFNAEDALRTARLGRELGISDMVKLEVLADTATLLPHPTQTLEATRILAEEGFTVLTYTSDDPVIAKQLEEIGVPVVMPAGAPIGSGQGILNRNNIRIILERAEVPIVVDAGVGVASDVCEAFELGCEAVLLNTAIAGAKDPVRMAVAMKQAAEAGRQCYLAGRIPKKLYANASSPDLDF